MLTCSNSSSCWLQVVLAISAICTALVSAASICEEKLQVLLGLGVTLEAKRRCGLVASSRFLDLHDISGVIINEGLTTSDVKFYLAFTLRGNQMALAFESLLPRLSILQPVYQEVHDLVAAAKLKQQGAGFLGAPR